MIPTEQIPLGTRIPSSLHAVSVSLPTMADVIGYEKREPAILARMNTGYPRFVKHECLREIERFWQSLFDCPNDSIWLTASEEIAQQLAVHLDCKESKYLRHQNVSGLRIPDDEQLNQESKLFLQHVGGYLCSRQAEDYLVSNQIRKEQFPEETFEGDSEAKVIGVLQPLLNVADSNDIALSNSGMNAIYAAFQAVNAVQRPKGRNSWIKLGWLYADTMHILDKLSIQRESNVDVFDVFDVEQLESLLSERPESFAGIITETPTNPLIQTMDLDRIRSLATEYGLYLVLDPTIASPANVDVSRHADILVNSLTKYAANQGDVIMGAIAVTPHCPDRNLILGEIKDHAIPPYQRVIDRLASQIDGYLPLIERINASTIRIVEYLEEHPKIENVHWALESKSRANFEKIARGPSSVGGMISFTLKDDIEQFYDRFSVSKGPSFGMIHSLACPFMYLAHFDLVSTDSGRAHLNSIGLNPELIRFSIGAEPAEDIIEALNRALES